MISLELADGSTVGYTHDAQGNRTSRTVDGLLDATWAWDDLSSLPMRIGEYDAAGTLATAWLADPTSSTGASLAQTSGGVSSWLLSDPFANTVATVSTTGGTVSGTRTMDAFGVERTSATGSLADAAVGFAGQYMDDATGLYDMRARDYDPSSGRFNATDPVAVPTGMPFVAGYSYSFNNPLMFSDVTGLNPFSDVVSGFWEEAGSFLADGHNRSVSKALYDWDGFYAAYHSDAQGFVDDYRQWGFAYAIDRRLNPVHQVLESGDATITAFKEGNYHEAGGHLFNTEVAVANTCLVAYGGAKFITLRIPSVRPPASATVSGATTANTGTALVKYDADFAVGQLTAGARATASQLDAFGSLQGWARSQTATGPVKFTDGNGVVRLTIKRGSPRAPGSGGPHVELRSRDGIRIDPSGNPVSRTSPGNHTPIVWDW